MHNLEDSYIQKADLELKKENLKREIEILNQEITALNESFTAQDSTMKIADFNRRKEDLDEKIKEKKTKLRHVETQLEDSVQEIQEIDIKNDPKTEFHKKNEEIRIQTVAKILFVGIRCELAGISKTLTESFDLETEIEDAPIMNETWRNIFNRIGIWNKKRVFKSFFTQFLQYIDKNPLLNQEKEHLRHEAIIFLLKQFQKVKYELQIPVNSKVFATFIGPKREDIQHCNNFVTYSQLQGFSHDDMDKGIELVNSVINKTIYKDQDKKNYIPKKIKTYQRRLNYRWYGEWEKTRTKFDLDLILFHDEEYNKTVQFLEKIAKYSNLTLKLPHQMQELRISRYLDEALKNYVEAISQTPLRLYIK